MRCIKCAKDNSESINFIDKNNNCLGVSGKPSIYSVSFHLIDSSELGLLEKFYGGEIDSGKELPIDNYLDDTEIKIREKDISIDSRVLKLNPEALEKYDFVSGKLEHLENDVDIYYARLNNDKILLVDFGESFEWGELYNFETTIKIAKGGTKL